MKTRIKALLEHKGLTSAKFADIIGVQRSSISHILSGRNNPSLDFIQKLMIKFPEIDNNWLLLGEGEMINSESKQMPNLGTIPFIKDEDNTQINKVTNVNSEIITEKINENVLISSTEKRNLSKDAIRIVYFYADNSFLEFFPAKA